MCQLIPQNWITITNAMAGVVNPASPSEPEGGTAPSAHIQGVDFAARQEARRW